MVASTPGCTLVVATTGAGSFVVVFALADDVLFATVFFVLALFTFAVAAAVFTVSFFAAAAGNAIG
jgi:hypothetical protein